MANLHSPTNWKELKLVKALDAKYQEALQRVYDHVAPLLGTRPIGAEDLTDHDLRHSSRVLQRAAQILPPTTRLDQSELYILCLAALLHDAGLWTTKQELLEVQQQSEFRRFARDNRTEAELDKVEELLSDGSTRWMGELALSRLVAWYHRSLHPQRLRTAVLNRNVTGDTLQTLIGSEYVQAVVTVSVAHSWTRERVLTDKSLDVQQFGDDIAHLRFLAVLLRLSDLMDLGEGRVSALLWAYLSPLAPESEIHWRKEATLKVELCTPEEIRISGNFDVQRWGMMAAEAHRLAKDWLDMLRNEIEGVALVLNSRMELQYQERLQFGPMRLDVEGVTANGLILGGEVAFQFDATRIFQILGDEIYGDRSIFIRELLQNAVDATRAQLIRDKRSGRVKSTTETSDAEPWNWPKAITSDPRYQIAITSTPLGDDENARYVEFTMTDGGIGMSLASIRDHFLQVGSSYYTTTKYRQEFTHTPISRFGIGFLSCLAVADRIEVVTRQHDEHAGLRLILQQPSSYFIVDSAPDAQPGTTVKLRLARKTMEELGLPTFPIRTLYFFAKPTEFCGGLAFIVSQWAAYVEFPIQVQGERIEPRDPREFVPPYTLRDTPVESLPVALVSESGSEIGRGRIFYEVLKNTHLPSMHSVMPQTHTVASYKGIGLSDGKISPGTHQVLAAIDFRRLPPRAMTAGRKFNLGWNFFSSVGDMICRELHSLTVKKLQGAGTEVAVMWSALLDRRIGSPSRNVDLIPVRTQEGLSWQTWDEARQRFPRLVLVPFHVAWKGPWDWPVPAVGLPNESLNGLGATRSDSAATVHAVHDCHLVSVDGLCSAYLYPPNADIAGLQYLHRPYTYTHAGLVKLQGTTAPRSLQECVPLDRRLVSDADLPEYDRKADPWANLGAHRYSRVGDGSILGNDAQHLFEAMSHWSLEGEEIVVSLPETDDWI